MGSETFLNSSGRCYNIFILMGAFNIFPAQPAQIAFAGIFQSMLAGSRILLAAAVYALAIVCTGSHAAVLTFKQLVIVLAAVDAIAGLAQRQRNFLVAGVVVTAVAINGFAASDTDSILTFRSIAAIASLAVGILAAKHAGNNGTNNSVLRTDVLAGIGNPSGVYLIGAFSVAKIGITAGAVPVFVVTCLLAVCRNNCCHILDLMSGRQNLLIAVATAGAGVNSQTVAGTGGSGSDIFCIAMTQCSYFFLSNDHFVTYGAVLAFGQAGIYAIGSNSGINDLSVTQSCDFFGRNSFTAIITGYCYRTGCGAGSIYSSCSGVGMCTDFRLLNLNFLNNWVCFFLCHWSREIKQVKVAVLINCKKEEVQTRTTFLIDK